MCIGRIQQDFVLEDTHKKIKHTSKHKYLGMYITVHGNTDEAIRDRVTQRCRHWIYNSIVKSIATQHNRNGLLDTR